MSGAAKWLPAPEHYIKTPAAPVTRVRAAHRGDPRSVSRDRQPVVNRGADLASLDRWLAGSMMSGDEQDEPVTGIFGPLQLEIDRPPRTIEIEAVKIDDAVGLERA